MLAYDICDRFRFTLLLVLRFLFIGTGHRLSGMKRLVGCLMKKCLHGLCLAHAFLDDNAVFLQVEESLRTGIDLFKRYRYRNCFLDCSKKRLISFNASCQFINSRSRNRFTISLADIKSAYRLECVNSNFNSFLYRLPVSMSIAITS